MMFDDLDDHEAAEQPNEIEADAMRRSFGTKPRKQLRPARQDDLFDPDPQTRIIFPTGGKSPCSE